MHTCMLQARGGSIWYKVQVPLGLPGLVFNFRHAMVHGVARMNAYRCYVPCMCACTRKCTFLCHHNEFKADIGHSGML